jgi:hypothetical protein
MLPGRRSDGHRLRSPQNPLRPLRFQDPSAAPQNGPEQTQQEYATAAFVDASGSREMEQLVNGNLGGAPSQKSHLKCKKIRQSATGSLQTPSRL